MCGHPSVRVCSMSRKAQGVDFNQVLVRFAWSASSIG
jgi:hypothetical protein